MSKMFCLFCHSLDFLLFLMGDRGFQKKSYVVDPWRPRCSPRVTSEQNFLFQMNLLTCMIKNEFQIIFILFFKIS
jgi:hypothetical protein